MKNQKYSRQDIKEIEDFISENSILNVNKIDGKYSLNLEEQFLSQLEKLDYSKSGPYFIELNYGIEDLVEDGKITFTPANKLELFQQTNLCRFEKSSKYLLENFAEDLVKEDKTKSNLYLSAQENNIEGIKKFISMGYDPNEIFESTDLSPFMHAVVRGDTIVMDELKKYGGDIYVKNSKNLNSFDLALSYNQIESLKNILKTDINALEKMSKPVFFDKKTIKSILKAFKEVLKEIAPEHITAEYKSQSKQQLKNVAEKLFQSSYTAICHALGQETADEKQVEEVENDI